MIPGQPQTSQFAVPENSAVRILISLLGLFGIDREPDQRARGMGFWRNILPNGRHGVRDPAYRSERRTKQEQRRQADERLVARKPGDADHQSDDEFSGSA